LLHKLQHSNCPPRKQHRAPRTEKCTTDSTEHHGQNRAPRTEQSTTDRTEHHGQNRIGQNRTQSHAQNHSHREQGTTDRTESDGIGHNHTHRTEPFTQTDHHRQNRIGQTNRTNRLGLDRSHGQNRIGQNRIGQNNRIDRTEHNHTDRMHHGTHTHDYTKSPSRGGADHARRGDVHERHVVQHEEGTCTNTMSSTIRHGRRNLRKETGQSEWWLVSGISYLYGNEQDTETSECHMQGGHHLA